VICLFTTVTFMVLTLGGMYFALGKPRP